MIAQKDALSPACRTVIARSLPEATPQKAASAPRTKKGGPINLNPAAAR
jgi:hypothetical protein